MIRLLLISIALITVLNGSQFWLNRLGWINTDSFNTLTLKNNDFNQRSTFYVNNPHLITQDVETAFKKEHLNYKKELYDHLYNDSALRVFLKCLKYLFCLFFLTFIFYANRKSPDPPNLKLFYCFLGGFLLIYSSLSFFSFGWATLAAGLNIYLFFIFFLSSKKQIGLKELRFLSVCLMATLGVLLLIAPIEMTKGLQVFNTNSFLKKRLVGFMDQPTTLGVYVVCVFSLFIILFRSKLSNLLLIITCLSTLLLVIMSGSNTAAIVMCIFIFLVFLSSLKGVTFSQAPWALLLFFVVTLSLYLTEGRPALDSLTGRFEKYQHYFSLDLTLLRFIFGHGLGIGSNTLLQIQSIFPWEQFNNLPVKFSLDSTPLLLIVQTGILGCVLFYGLLFMALIKDQQLRLSYIAFILCSLTINIIEVFPLNIVLAFMLSHSLFALAQANVHSTLTVS